MHDDIGAIYPLAYGAVLHQAPGASGVYTVSGSHRWVFVGESDDIRQSLLEHLNDPSAPMDRFGPLSFSFQTVPAGERVPRQKALVAELKPVFQPTT